MYGFRVGEESALHADIVIWAKATWQMTILAFFKVLALKAKNMRPNRLSNIHKSLV